MSQVLAGLFEGGQVLTRGVRVRVARSAMFEQVDVDVAAHLDPFVVLLGQDGYDEADDRDPVGEYPYDIGAAAHFLVQAFAGIVGPDLLPAGRGERDERQNVRSGGLQVFGHGGSLSIRVAWIRSNWACTASASGWSYTLCNSALTYGQELFGVALIRFAARAEPPLPTGAGQRRADRLDLAGVRVGDDQADGSCTAATNVYGPAPSRRVRCRGLWLSR